MAAPQAPRSNGWTGAQYSLYRAIIGGVLVGLFLYLGLWFWRIGVAGTAVAGVGIPLSMLFLIGFWHRTAAGLLIGLILTLQFVPEHDLGPGPILVMLVLALHLFVPANPFGSFPARGSMDPAGGWKMPTEVRLAAWIFLSLLYVGQGVVLYRAESDMFRLEGSVLWTLVVVHCGFGLWAVVRMLRPWLWLLMLGVQLYLIFSPLEMEWVAWVLPVHLFVFDPAWIRPALGDRAVITFYDGNCGLCHRAVRFVLSEDRADRATDFAPLGGDTFQELVGDIPNLPDSMLVLREDGTLLVRSTAALFLMRRLGGLWRLASWGLVLVPRLLRDGLYDLVAACRTRMFPPPDDVCPLIPSRLRERFLDIGS